MSTVVPILLYHAITHDPGNLIAPFTVTPQEFERHLDLLVQAGYRCTSFGELVDGGAEPDRGTDRTAVITFDDGYADFASAALPALQARSLPSTMFLTTGWLEGAGAREPGPTDRMLDWSQLPELAEAGVELGAHSHSHPQMDTLGASALRDELDRPRRLLEEALGQPVTTFAYPHGYNGPRVRRATRASGYRCAAGVRDRLHRPGEDTFNVSRLMLTASTTTDDVRRWLDGVDGRSDSDRESLATRGWRAYRRGRALLRRRPGSDYR